MLHEDNDVDFEFQNDAPIKRDAVNQMQLHAVGDNHVRGLNTDSDKGESINHLSPLCQEDNLWGSILNCGSQGTQESTKQLMGSGQFGPLVEWSHSGPTIHAVGGGAETAAVVRHVGSGLYDDGPTKQQPTGPTNQPNVEPLHVASTRLNATFEPALVHNGDFGPAINHNEDSYAFGRVDIGPTSNGVGVSSADQFLLNSSGDVAGSLAGREDRDSVCVDTAAPLIRSNHNQIPSSSVPIGAQAEMGAIDLQADLELCEVPILSLEDVQDLGSLCARINEPKREVVQKKRRGRPRKKAPEPNTIRDSHLDLSTLCYMVNQGPSSVAEFVWGIGKELGISNAKDDGVNKQLINNLMDMEIRDIQSIGRDLII
ncbi:L-serine ammonia-lyase [Sesbania bispinosa]|nr:L-serine ammonia-lyase [Sesbania bispinosa]